MNDQIEQRLPNNGSLRATLAQPDLSGGMHTCQRLYKAPLMTSKPR